MKRYLALLTAVLGLLALATPVAAQEQDQQSGPTVLVVHEVDSRESSTLVTVLADDYRIGQDIEIKLDGDKVDPTRFALPPKPVSGKKSSSSSTPTQIWLLATSLRR